jgi:hypothetical protein
MTKPSDLDYDDDGFILPPLNIQTHYVNVDYVPDDQLLFTNLHGVGDRSNVRRVTIAERVKLLQEIIDNDEQWIVWVGLDGEGSAATKAIPGAVEVKGSDDVEYKAQTSRLSRMGRSAYWLRRRALAGSA